MDRGTVGLPGAFNGLVARAAADAGFEGLYVSGAAVSASFGVPDVGLVTLGEFASVIEQVARASGLPVLADADTGFGEAEMVRRTVFEYHRAGAAGLHIEDQVFPKRCGHLDGKELIATGDMVNKVRYAAEASRACSGGAFVVCARTDARHVEGFEAAVQRAAAYVAAGADMIFPEGLESEAEFARFAEHLRTATGAKVRSGRGPYLLANMTEFGKTPITPIARFAELGYHAVIWPVTTLRAAMGEVTRILADLKRDGTVQAFLPRLQTRQQLYGLLRYKPGVEWEWPGR
ncbi:MAG: isocitrate lyase/phosphoenolpyruvate mutase family protein [Phycisphaerales bacterium]|nr:isocitrate lyase/phosphoenolpyruvate mutase family protein [Phycisphaerales bacterium]